MTCARTSATAISFISQLLSLNSRMPRALDLAVLLDEEVPDSSSFDGGCRAGHGAHSAHVGGAEHACLSAIAELEAQIDGYSEVPPNYARLNISGHLFRAPKQKGRDVNGSRAADPGHSWCRKANYPWI